MKVYLIVVVDSYNLECATNKCFASREKAKKYCEKNNVYTYNIHFLVINVNLLGKNNRGCFPLLH